MAEKGESFLSYYTADWYNRVNALLGGMGGSTGNASASGPLTITKTKGGIQVVAPKLKLPVSTIQGYLVGGSPPPVTNGTEILDVSAWGGYKIMSAWFILATGTCTVTIKINGVAISWLTNISVSTTQFNYSVTEYNPAIDNVVKPYNQVTAVITSASSNAAGLAFSLNTPS